MSFRFFQAGWAAALFALLIIQPISAQVTFPIHNLQANPIFGESISFSAEIDPGVEFESISLVFRLVSTGKSTVLSAQIEDDQRVTALYQIQDQDYLPAFATIEYWFNIKFTDGNQKQSQIERIVYQDDRYAWQKLDSGQYQISWVDGDLTFGQEVQDALLQSIDSYSKFLDLPEPDSLNIYIYPNPTALQSALKITNAQWIAGHANPAENSILVSIPSGFDQILDIKRQIPHELTHIRLYLYLQENYQNLPSWYNEGLASLAELYTLTEYWQILNAAWKNDTLIPLSELCSGIPSEPNQAALAYAEANSFTAFLNNKYGKAGLQNLLDAYNDGHTCKNGVQASFNKELEELEKDWYQATFNSSILPQSLASALTWIILMLLLLITPLGLVLSGIRKTKRQETEDE